MIFGHRELLSSLTSFHCLPDWQSPSDYDYLKGREPDQLAWEFLRRNKTYIAAFFEWLPVWQDWWRPDVATPSKAVDDGCAALCVKFGLSEKFGPRHPSSLMAPTFEDAFRPNVDILARWTDGVEMDFYHPPPPDCRNCIDVRIVAERPLEEQLERIRIMYDDMTRGAKHPKKANNQDALTYGTYLRILDALQAGASVAAIARAFAPDEDKSTSEDRVKKQKKRACGLVDFGYLALVRPHWRG